MSSGLSTIVSKFNLVYSKGQLGCRNGVTLSILAFLLDNRIYSPLGSVNWIIAHKSATCSGADSYAVSLSKKPLQDECANRFRLQHQALLVYGRTFVDQTALKHSTSHNIHAKSRWRQTFLYRPSPCRPSQFGRISSKTVDVGWTPLLGVVAVLQRSSLFTLMVRPQIRDCFSRRYPSTIASENMDC